MNDIAAPLAFARDGGRATLGRTAAAPDRPRRGGDERLRARRDAARRRGLGLRSRRLRRPAGAGRPRRRGPRRPCRRERARRRRRRGRALDGHPAREPRARRGARARPARPPARRAARAAERAQAHDRDRRRARQDHDDVDDGARAAALRARARLPDRRGADHDRPQRRLGGGGVARGRGRRVGPLDALAARRRGRGDERRARPPRDLRLAGRGARGLPRAAGRRAAGRPVGPPRRARPARRCSPRGLRRPRAGARRGRIDASSGAGTPCAWPSRAPTTRATPPPPWRPWRWPAPTPRPPPRRWRTSPAPGGASRPWAPRAAARA